MSNPAGSSRSGPSIAPRSEAGVLRIPATEERAAQYRLGEEKASQDLTPEQSDVVLRVQGLVNEMAAWETPPLTDTPRFLPRIEQRRESRVILIDGDSGSGKTSVLLTLIDHWSSRISLQEDRAAEWGPGVPLFPIGILDLQPLPPSTNLILHVASTLRKVIDTIEGELPTSTNPAAPWHPLRQQELKSQNRWREFVRAAVAGSDGSSQRRDLDPEALVLELEEAERERLDVARAFFQLVDALVNDLAHWYAIPGTRPPLLILSIDDADMNPHFSVALLNLLRILYHPRLAYLLTGNSELFTTMLRMHFSGTLFRPVERISLSPSDVGELQHDCDRLARLTYDRLVPDRQRCRIEDLATDKRLHELKHALSLVRLDTFEPVEPKTIYTYFALIPRMALALPATMRGIVDLRAQLNLRSSVTDGSTRHVRLVVWLVKYLWDQAVRGTYFAPDDRHALDSCVYITEDGNLSVQPNQIRWRAILTPHFRLPLAPPFSALVSQLQPIRAWFESAKERHVLPSTAVAAFMLANIVAVDGVQDFFLRSPAIGPIFDTTLMRIEFNYKNVAKLNFGWPLPDPVLLLDSLIISDCWKAVTGVPNASAETMQIQQLAVFFLEVVIETADNRNASLVTPRNNFGTEVWNELATKLAKLIQAQPAASGLKTTRQQMFEDWARDRAGLLAAPESGLPSEVAREFLGSLRRAVSEEEWQSIALGLKAARQARARHVLRLATRRPGSDEQIPSGEVEELLQCLDLARKDSPWVVVEETVRRGTASSSPKPRQQKSLRKKVERG